MDNILYIKISSQKVTVIPKPAVELKAHTKEVEAVHSQLGRVLPNHLEISPGNNAPIGVYHLLGSEKGSLACNDEALFALTALTKQYKNSRQNLGDLNYFFDL